MNLQNVWEICKFSDEIVYGKLDMSKFAVELHSVLDGSADKTYTDPNLFFKNNFLTSNARLMLKDALLRLSQGDGQPIYIIDTEFGGGKTHTLILLYHFFNNQGLAKEYLREYKFIEDYNILEVPRAKVVAIDCRRLKKNTLWGQIADSLGKYNEIREYDQNKQQINDIDIIKSFFSTPTLLLIDELPHYLISADAEKIGNVTLADLTIAFIMTLISAIASSKNSILLMTLTAKQQLYENYTGRIKNTVKNLGDFRVDTLVDNFKEGLSRQVQFKTPVDKREVYEVIKKRLVKDISEKDGNNTVESFIEYFVEKGIPIEHEFKNNIKKAYPFHPFLIDTLYERVSSIDKFNKTRGMLRLLGLVLHNIYKKQEDCKLVSTSHIQLNNDEIAEELTSRIDRAEFKIVIESDCVKKAKDLDEKRHIKIFEKVARTIYLYSLIGSTKISGIKTSDISLAIGEPGLDPSIIQDALNEMDRQFWYLKKNGVEYYFDKEPQINKIIYDYMQEVSHKDIKFKIKETLGDLLSEKVVNIIVWDKERLEDNDNLKIFVLDYEEKINEDNKKEFLKSLVEYKPDGGIRDFQNTIIFVFADEYGIESIIDQARMVCAINNAHRDERIKLNKQNLDKIKSRIEEAEGNLNSECLKVYSKVGYPHFNDIKFDTISTFETNKHDITESVLSLLEKKGKLILENLSPEVISDNIQDKEKLEDIYTLFKKDKSKKFLLNGKVILDAVRNGVRNGLFGYASSLSEKNEDKYIATIGKDMNINWDGFIIKKDLVFKESIPIDIQSESFTNFHTSNSNNILKKEEKDQQTYEYRIDFNHVKEIVSFLEKYSILSITGNTIVDCYVELKNDFDTITIHSKLKQINEIKSLIQLLFNTYRYIGGGHANIQSDKDLLDDFVSYNIEAKRL